MTNQDFFDHACIAAMQELMKESNAPPERIASMAQAYAMAMLSERGKRRWDDDATQHRIAELEQSIANLTCLIEHNYPGWINTPTAVVMPEPALYGNEHEHTVFRPEVAGTKDRN